MTRNADKSMYMENTIEVLVLFQPNSDCNDLKKTLKENRRPKATIPKIRRAATTIH
jgi:hypothetical protein